MANNTILVTGGAGYIGSHVVRQLGDAGERIVVLDNLSTGFKQAVLYGHLVIGDCGDQELVTRILLDYSIDTIMHFAAHTIVADSITNPLKYYDNNTCSSRKLMHCASQAGVKYFIFSSTAAVYGVAEVQPVTEDTQLNPVNAYGTSKLMTEWMLRDLSQATDMRHVALRYFNVAGCDPQGRIGQSTPAATLLTKVACEAATGKRDSVSIFGTDYPTPDGTGVRDYIHVEDLADAHIRALQHLRSDGESVTLNCGYGHGYSVREVLDAVTRANGKPLNIKERARRAGDPPTLIADSSKMQALFDWRPEFDDLDKIVKTSLAWERKLAAQA